MIFEKEWQEILDLMEEENLSFNQAIYRIYGWQI